MNAKKIFFLITASLLSCHFSIASDQPLLSLEGVYIAYSYDYNQVYAEEVKFKFLSFDVSCSYLKIDIPSRTFYAFGDVVLQKKDQVKTGDEFLFDPQQNEGILQVFSDRVYKEYIGGEKKEETILLRSDVIDDLSLSKIQTSFIYFTGQKIQITEDFEVYGYNMTLHLEGIQSVAFKKFKLSEGLDWSGPGFHINRIWYTKSQGIIGRASYVYEKRDKVNSITQINYEERSVLKNYYGPKRQVDIMTSTTLNFSENLNLSLSGNYNSSNLWNMNFRINKRWGNKLNTNLGISYNKPINFKGEAWIELGSTVDGGKLGNVSFSGRFGNQSQILGNFSYSNMIFKNFNVVFNSSYSKIKIVSSTEYSEILSGGISLSYSSKIFNLSTDYYLNSDLFGDQLLSQPQLRIGLNPFNFYGGILTASITNVFIYNILKQEDLREENYSNNTIFNLSTSPIYIQKSFWVNLTFALEQFVEKEGRNFTSAGFIVNANKEILRGVSLEGFYSIQSRRRTKDWLIEGTTSQDLSAVFRVNPSETLNGWISLSYDPKYGEWRQSFADISIEIIKNWKFHSLFNYDFLLKKINNVDLFLIREAGRFQLRFIWRSISKQFLVELIPR